MEGFCRACLNKFNESTELFQYCESNRRLFVYCTGLQVKRNDAFTFQLCKECFINLKFACKFKKQCKTSDKKIKSYLALKRDGESVDFSTYLKNVGDKLTLRLPITSSSNTPVHQKNYDDDDDNVSTCTSIQNFMSDMLQGEEMHPTEVRIIREVIQEEADILEDSLDSHWLQDDMSVDNDFGMDFNFAGFSTPHSINNDHCYTPRRLTNDKEDDTYYYTPKDTLQKSDNNKIEHDGMDMPLLEIDDDNAANCKWNVQNTINYDEKEINDMSILVDSDVEFDGIIHDKIIINDLNTEYLNNSIKDPNNEHITVILNKGVASGAINSSLTNELEYYMNKVELNKMSCIKICDIDGQKFLNDEKNLETVLNQHKDLIMDQLSIEQNHDHDEYITDDKINLNQGNHNIESNLTCELEQYINKAEMKKKVYIPSNQNKCLSKKCSIDRNMEMALKNDDGQEFSLDQLLISPQVSIRSGASTPTINNILFGNLTPRDMDTIVADLGSNTVKKEPDTNFIEEFPKDDKRQSTPKKTPKENRRIISVKDLNKLKESILKPHKGIGKGQKRFKRPENKPRNQGYKNIKDLSKYENKICTETSDSEQPLSATSSIKEEPIEFEKEISYETLGCEILENSYKTVVNDNDDDLDISISNLLQFDESRSVDLNISIASDFLKDEKLYDDDNKAQDPESIFKMPFSPPDNKYDFDQKLCKICDKTYMSKCALRIHFIKAHKQRLPTEKRKKASLKICPKCGKGFRDKSNFNKHMQKHEDPDNFKCEFCTLDFPTRGSFKKHLRCHANEIANKEKTVLPNKEPDKVDNERKDDDLQDEDNGQYKDERGHNENEIGLDKEGDIKTKQQENDGKVSKSYVCPICGKVLKTVGSFNIHVRRHNKIYSEKCELCQKGFFRKYDLNIHMATHNLGHKFSCEYCPKTFRSRHFLIGHMYLHLGKYKFKCDFCQRVFISKHHLQQHNRTQRCLKNRLALDESHEAAEVTITYKPVVFVPKDSVTESPEDNVTKDDDDTVER